MMYRSSSYRRTSGSSVLMNDRLYWLQWLLIAGVLIVVGRLFFLQVVQGASYKLLASNQHELRKILVPERGKILVRDRADGTLHPLATNRDSWQLYVEPRNMSKPGDVAQVVAPFTKETEEVLVERWKANPQDPYEPIAKGLETPVINELLSKGLKGIGAAKTWARSYPEANIGGQMIGFVRMDDTSGIGQGVYGLEGSFDDVLAGRSGFISAQKDAGGRRLMLDGGKMRYAVNGSDIVLTIDRTIQHEVCARVKNAVETYQAMSGTVVVMRPDTGAIIAMCSWPDFDPVSYGETKDISVFNNPATYGAYEPGSVFKPITMAIGIDAGKVGPNTTYTDPGVEKIDTFEIKNSDEQAHGVQTMRQVLEKSLNTGTIFVERLLGRGAFQSGVEAFGFGKKTGIELSPESVGNISSLKKKAEVYGATASFGQGITVTPIQLASSFAALANGGRLLRPYIVDEIVYPDGQRKRTEPVEVGRPISARTSELMKGMLVSVVERGHGATAGVPGYFVAGKTGTAQVASSRGGGYLEGAIVSTFAGFAPADHPAFVMVVKMDRPKVGKWAEVNASPLFKELSSFMLSYLEIPMERDITTPTEIQSVPDLPVEAAAGAPDVVSIDTGTSVKPEDAVQNGNPLEENPVSTDASSTAPTQSSP